MMKAEDIEFSRIECEYCDFVGSAIDIRDHDCIEWLTSERLAMLKEIESLQQENKQLNLDIGAEIFNRDEREEVINKMFELVIGHSPEWSNLFGFIAAINQVDEKMHYIQQEKKALREALKRDKEQAEKSLIEERGHMCICKITCDAIIQRATKALEGGERWKQVI